MRYKCVKRSSEPKDETDLVTAFCLQIKCVMRKHNGFKV